MHVKIIDVNDRTYPSILEMPRFFIGLLPIPYEFRLEVDEEEKTIKVFVFKFDNPPTKHKRYFELKRLKIGGYQTLNLAQAGIENYKTLKAYSTTFEGFEETERNEIPATILNFKILKP